MGEQFVIDASVVMAWCFEDEASLYADAVLERLAKATAIAPIIWPLEVGNVLVVAERRGRITAAETVRFLDLLRQLPIAVEGGTASRIFGEILALAREQRLSTYDAAYLDLAMRAGLPLATQDAALRQAAARCGVPVYLEG
ncbi:MAG: PIN domain-containing protein [Chloroflexi bacterium]|nr:MAG: PIN domain-containing protein [Chloroflexota bacterium]